MKFDPEHIKGNPPLSTFVNDPDTYDKEWWDGYRAYIKQKEQGGNMVNEQPQETSSRRINPADISAITTYGQLSNIDKHRVRHEHDADGNLTGTVYCAFDAEDNPVFFRVKPGKEGLTTNSPVEYVPDFQPSESEQIAISNALLNLKTSELQAQPQAASEQPATQPQVPEQTPEQPESVTTPEQTQSAVEAAKRVRKAVGDRLAEAERQAERSKNQKQNSISRDKALANLQQEYKKRLDDWNRTVGTHGGYPNTEDEFARQQLEKWYTEQKNHINELYDQAQKVKVKGNVTSEDISNAATGAITGLSDYFAQRLRGKEDAPGAQNLRNQAALHDKQAADEQANEQQNRQIANRDYRGEAEKNAVAGAATENAQKVANLGNVSAGAAALARGVKSADYDTHMARQDEQREKAVEKQREAYGAQQTAEEERQAAEAENNDKQNMDFYNNIARYLSMGGNQTAGSDEKEEVTTGEGTGSNGTLPVSEESKDEPTPTPTPTADEPTPTPEGEGAGDEQPEATSSAKDNKWKFGELYDKYNPDDKILKDSKRLERTFGTWQNFLNDTDTEGMSEGEIAEAFKKYNDEYEEPYKIWGATQANGDFRDLPEEQQGELKDEFKKRTSAFYQWRDANPDKAELSFDDQMKLFMQDYLKQQYPDAGKDRSDIAGSSSVTGGNPTSEGNYRRKPLSNAAGSQPEPESKGEGFAPLWKAASDTMQLAQGKEPAPEQQTTPEQPESAVTNAPEPEPEPEAQPQAQNTGLSWIDGTGSLQKRLGEVIGAEIKPVEGKDGEYTINGEDRPLNAKEQEAVRSWLDANGTNITTRNRNSDGWNAFGQWLLSHGMPERDLLPIDMMREEERGDPTAWQPSGTVTGALLDGYDRGLA